MGGSSGKGKSSFGSGIGTGFCRYLDICIRGLGGRLRRRLGRGGGGRWFVYIKCRLFPCVVCSVLALQDGICSDLGGVCGLIPVWLIAQLLHVFVQKRNTVHAVLVEIRVVDSDLKSPPDVANNWRVIHGRIAFSREHYGTKLGVQFFGNCIGVGATANVHRHVFSCLPGVATDLVCNTTLFQIPADSFGSSVIASKVEMQLPPLGLWNVARSYTSGFHWCGRLRYGYFFFLSLFSNGLNRGLGLGSALLERCPAVV